ncbi:MAG: thioesterase [Holophagales bacterium]|nr:thioesterase [Holophagales bacterium]
MADRSSHGDDLFASDPPEPLEDSSASGDVPAVEADERRGGDLATVMPDKPPARLLDDADSTEEFQPLPREQYRIRSAEVDPAGKATPTALANLLQEAAASDARRLGFGVEQLRSRGLGWYLARLILRLRRIPWIGETVEIETWPSGISGIHALRDFRLFLDSGPDAVEVGAATSGWLLVDLERKRPVRRLLAELEAHHPDPPRRALDVAFERLSSPEDGDAEGQPFPLRRTDLDLNGHVNYGVLVGAVMEAVPDGLWQGADLEELDIEFRAEARPGDGLRTLAAEREPESAETTSVILHHAVTRVGDDRQLVRARSRWRPI